MSINASILDPTPLPLRVIFSPSLFLLSPHLLPPIDQRSHPERLSLRFASGYPMLPKNCGTNNNRCIEINKITTSKTAGRTVITKLLVKYRLWNTLNVRMTWDAALSSE